MTAKTSFGVLVRVGLALGAVGLLFQTTCTLNDLLSAYGLSTLLSGLTAT